MEISADIKQRRRSRPGKERDDEGRKPREEGRKRRRMDDKIDGETHNWLEKETYMHTYIQSVGASVTKTSIDRQPPRRTQS